MAELGAAEVVVGLDDVDPLVGAVLDNVVLSRKVAGKAVLDL